MSYLCWKEWKMQCSSSFFWAQQCLKPHLYIISCWKMFLNWQRVEYWNSERETPPEHTGMPVCIPEYTASMLCKRNYWTKSRKWRKRTFWDSGHNAEGKTSTYLMYGSINFNRNDEISIANWLQRMTRK